MGLKLETQNIKIWNEVKQLYKKYCVAQNATIHDIGHENQNYEQRKFAIEDLVFRLQQYYNLDDSLINYLSYINQDIKKQVWTRSADKQGSIIYICLSDKKEPIIR